MLILAIMAALGYSTYRAARLSAERTEESLKRSREIEFGMRIMVQDIAQAVPRPVRDMLGQSRLPTMHGTPGAGTFHHLNAELFKSMFGLQLVNVPYKGTLPALTDVMAGHIQFMFSDVPPALGLVAAGKLRALGVTTRERVTAAPDIAPLNEVGMPGYEAASWHMVATQGHVPPEIVAKLNTEIRAIMNDPEVRASLIRDGAIPQVSPSPDELKVFVKSEIARWGKIVEAAGFAHSE